MIQNMIPPKTTAFAFLVVLLILTAAGIGLGLVGAEQASAQQPDAKAFEFFEPFKGEPNARVGLWGAEADKFVKNEPDGLRITMPAGHAGERPFTGINTTIAVKGDFEISVNYEILKAPEIVEGDFPSMKLILMAVLDRKQFNPAMLVRLRTGDGDTKFSTWVNLTNMETGKKKIKGAKQFPANAPKGALRMVRKGRVLSIHVMEDPETKFRYLKEFPDFPGEDLKFVRVLATTGNAKAELDVRYSDLRIRWGALDGPVAAQDVDDAQAAISKSWLALAVLIGAAIILLFAIVLSAALYFRRRAAVDATGTLVQKSKSRNA